MSIAGSVLWANLHAVDRVDLLYAGSQDLSQSGDMIDVRLGLLEEQGPDAALEVLLLYNRLDMTQRVRYVDEVWLDERARTQLLTRDVVNYDRSNTRGLHLGYARSLGESGWRAGGILTANHKSHPKIPSYEIMNVPRDPGDSWAFNLGAGVSRSKGPLTLGFDVVYEPIWSYTWSDAEGLVRTRSGSVLPAGGKAIENDFRFSNVLIRLGLRHEGRGGGFQLGMRVRSIDYALEQRDNVAGTKRTQNEAWMEWAPSWGAILKLSGLEFRYSGSLMTGTGTPGVASEPRSQLKPFSPLNSDFILAPDGPLTLQEEAVFTNQFTVSIPIDR